MRLVLRPTLHRWHNLKHRDPDGLLRDRPADLGGCPVDPPTRMTAGAWSSVLSRGRAAMSGFTSLVGPFCQELASGITGVLPPPRPPDGSPGIDHAGTAESGAP